HVDPPTEHKAYLHRSGRTARAGAKGAVVTVILPDQAREVASMIRLAGVRPASSRVGPGALQTAALTGPAAEPVYRPQTAPASPGPTRGPAKGSSGAYRGFGGGAKRPQRTQRPGFGAGAGAGAGRRRSR
ncbi:MAG: hypothetical protein QOJ69_2093, partial [Actinomycetota bacterium]|nr:hypothetical protein [Actinomycetota bacterium]